VTVRAREGVSEGGASREGTGVEGERVAREAGGERVMVVRERVVEERGVILGERVVDARERAKVVVGDSVVMWEWGSRADRAGVEKVLVEKVQGVGRAEA